MAWRRGDRRREVLQFDADEASLYKMVNLLCFRVIYKKQFLISEKGI